MAKYIYNTPEHVNYVKRNKKGDIEFEVAISNFHNEESVKIIQPNFHIAEKIPNESRATELRNLDMEDIEWLLDILQDARSILEMKKQEEDE